MMGWYNDGWGAAGMTGMFFMVIFWASLIGLAVWVIARMTRKEQTHPAVLEPARAILDRRFASGEIDAQAYAEARRVLDSPGSAARTEST